ncbi:MAG: adenine phosphoribosyltransferase [Clostridiaceae bacterium]|nr:adenine phosphoribosyltransferase [Clostridiaceae bacterium]
MDLESKLRHVMDFPRPGIDFIDITTVLQDAEALKDCLGQMKEKVIEIAGEDFDLIVGPESRGFIFGAPLAYMLGKGFVLIRKKGKLPYKTVSVEYELEYGKDVLEIHEDAIEPGQKVVIVDDLLATGGTSYSNIQLVKKLGGKVMGLVYFVELTYLKGREKLKDYRVESIVKIHS